MYCSTIPFFINNPLIIIIYTTIIENAGTLYMNEIQVFHIYMPNICIMPDRMLV